MFWAKTKSIEAVPEDRKEKVAIEAEGLYLSGKMHCAEAVLTVIKDNFMPEAGEEIVRLAAGFGGGSGTGCICGAVAGGTMALGLVSKDNKKWAAQLTKELHHWFKREYGATCCKVILQTHKKICPMLTGRVAWKVAELIESKGQ